MSQLTNSISSTSVPSTNITGGHTGYLITGNSSCIKPAEPVEIINRLKIIEERLAILEPDLLKLEKFAALKTAYDNYKTIESLCKDQT